MCFFKKVFKMNLVNILPIVILLATTSQPCSAMEEDAFSYSVPSSQTPRKNLKSTKSIQVIHLNISTPLNPTSGTKKSSPPTERELITLNTNISDRNGSINKHYILNCISEYIKNSSQYEQFEFYFDAANAFNLFTGTKPSDKELLDRCSWKALFSKLPDSLQGISFANFPPSSIEFRLLIESLAEVRPDIKITLPPGADFDNI